MVDGIQVPVTPFVEVPSNVPGVAPTQYGPKAAKAGVTLALTATFIVAVVAHCPAVGVNVKVNVPEAAVLMVDGLQVPVTPFVEAPSNVPGVAPTQYGPKAAKVGVTLALTATSMVVPVEHCPAVGVNA